MMKKLLKKLRSSKGFSMSEMLVATLILGLMTTALASGISSAQRIYYNSVTYSEKRMLLSTICDTIRTELRYAKEVKFKTTQTDFDSYNNSEYTDYTATENLYVLDTYTSANYGFNTQLCSSDSGNPEIIKKVNDETKRFALVGSGVYSDDKLKVKFFDNNVFYDASKGVFVVTVQVYADTKNPEYENRTMTVKPLEKPTITETTTS